jgi:hypothetical protein
LTLRSRGRRPATSRSAASPRSGAVRGLDRVGRTRAGRTTRSCTSASVVRCRLRARRSPSRSDYEGARRVRGRHHDIAHLAGRLGGEASDHLEVVDDDVGRVRDSAAVGRALDVPRVQRVLVESGSEQHVEVDRDRPRKGNRSCSRSQGRHTPHGAEQVLVRNDRSARCSSGSLASTRPALLAQSQGRGCPGDRVRNAALHDHRTRAAAARRRSSIRRDTRVRAVAPATALRRDR